MVGTANRLTMATLCIDTCISPSDRHAFRIASGLVWKVPVDPRRSPTGPQTSWHLGPQSQRTVGR